MSAAVSSSAQPFTDLHSSFPTLSNSSASWADYDNDGKPDFALIGFSSVAAEVSTIYHNDGGGIFSLAFILSIPVASGAVTWGDYDNDGDLDLLVNGQNGGTGPLAVTTIVRNDGLGVFTEISSAVPGVVGVARWIDYDGDGWLDVITIGFGVTMTGDSTRLFHNDTNGTFTEIPSNLTGFVASDISVVDFDNDGDMDFFITGGTVTLATFPVSKLFMNNGTGSFTEVPFSFTQLSLGTSSWADYDQDGDLDLLYDGVDSTGLGTSLIYRNTGAGNFTLINANLPGSGEPGSVGWADIDNDGDLDILLGGPSILLRNDGSNVFTDITQVDFPDGVSHSFADIDNNGYPDILFIAVNGGATASTIFRNDNLLSSVTNIKNDFDFTIYPNPVIDKIRIESSAFNVARVDIYNVFREIIASQNSMVIDVSQLSSGIYFVVVRNEKNNTGSRIFLKL